MGFPKTKKKALESIIYGQDTGHNTICNQWRKIYRALGPDSRHVVAKEIIDGFIMGKKMRETINKFKGYMALEALAAIYFTDKLTHGYLTHYVRYFENYRSTVHNVLEIGIKEGASLKMWSDYFPSAMIYGVDRREECCKYLGPRIVTVHGSQSSMRFVEKLQDVQFDLIVDDGSHVQFHQQLAMTKLFPLLKEGGVYVIEDLHAGRFEKYNTDKPVKDLTVDWVKGVSSTEVFDDKISFTVKESNDHFLPPIRH